MDINDFIIGKHNQTVLKIEQNFIFIVGSIIFCIVLVQSYVY